MNDPIVAEVRAIREKLAAECAFDVHRMVEESIRRQQAFGRVVVSRASNRSPIASEANTAEGPQPVGTAHAPTNSCYDVLKGAVGPAEMSAMTESTISIRVPESTARAFENASEQDRLKLELLLSLRLQELIEKPARPLTRVMDEIGARAEERGLTDAELETILNES